MPGVERNMASPLSMQIVGGERGALKVVLWTRVVRAPPSVWESCARALRAFRRAVGGTSPDIGRASVRKLVPSLAKATPWIFPIGNAAADANSAQIAQKLSICGQRAQDIVFMMETRNATYLGLYTRLACAKRVKSRLRTL